MKRRLTVTPKRKKRPTEIPSPRFLNYFEFVVIVPYRPRDAHVRSLRSSPYTCVYYIYICMILYPLVSCIPCHTIPYICPVQVHIPTHTPFEFLTTFRRNGPLFSFFLTFSAFFCLRVLHLSNFLRYSWQNCSVLFRYAHMQPGIYFHLTPPTTPSLIQFSNVSRFFSYRQCGPGLTFGQNQRKPTSDDKLTF